MGEINLGWRRIEPPREILEALLYTDYDFEPPPMDSKKGVFSVTEITSNDPCLVILRRRYAKEIKRDPFRWLFAFLGSAVHHRFLECGLADGSKLIERRFTRDVPDVPEDSAIKKLWPEGIALTGKLDAYYEDIVSDLKYTSVYTVRYTFPRKSWERQILLNAWLLGEERNIPKRGRLLVVYRDWSQAQKQKAENMGNAYPVAQLEVYETDITEAAIKQCLDNVRQTLETIAQLWGTPDAELPPCEGENAWEGRRCTPERCDYTVYCPKFITQGGE